MPMFKNSIVGHFILSFKDGRCLWCGFKLIYSQEDVYKLACKHSVIENHNVILRENFQSPKIIMQFSEHFSIITSFRKFFKVRNFRRTKYFPAKRLCRFFEVKLSAFENQTAYPIGEALVRSETDSDTLDSENFSNFFGK